MGGFKEVRHLLVIVVSGFFEILAPFVVGIDPILDEIFAFLGNPSGLCQETIVVGILLNAYNKGVNSQPP